MFLRYMTRVNRRQANAQQIRVSIYIYIHIGGMIIKLLRDY